MNLAIDWEYTMSLWNLQWPENEVVVERVNPRNSRLA
jgi:hypothetical protein